MKLLRLLSRNLAVTCIVALLLCGCRTHGVFVEAGHAGLYIEFSENGITPVNIDLGLERSVLAFVPQLKEPVTGEDDKPLPSGINDPCLGSEPPEECSDEKRETILTLTPDSGELAGMYSWYDAQLKLSSQKINVDYFLATGVAASNIVANPENVKSMWLSFPMENSGEGEGK